MGTLTHTPGRSNIVSSLDLFLKKKSVDLDTWTWLTGWIQSCTECLVKEVAIRSSSIHPFSAEVSIAVCWLVVHLVQSKTSLVKETFSFRTFVAARENQRLNLFIFKMPIALSFRLLVPEQIRLTNIPIQEDFFIIRITILVSFVVCQWWTPLAHNPRTKGTCLCFWFWFSLFLDPADV